MLTKAFKISDTPSPAHAGLFRNPNIPPFVAPASLVVIVERFSKLLPYLCISIGLHGLACLTIPNLPAPQARSWIPQGGQATLKIEFPQHFDHAVSPLRKQNISISHSPVHAPLLGNSIPFSSDDEIIPGSLLSITPPILEGSIDEGFMVLAIHLDREGTAENIEVIYSDFPTSISERFANSFKDGRYRPSTQGGHAIPSTLMMKVTAGRPRA